MNELQLSAITIYPVKSLGGIVVERAKVEERGFAHDRRWMLVDEEGMFFTQREYPKMALVTLQIHEDGLKMSAPGQKERWIPFQLTNPEKTTVQVWQSVCEAYLVGREADRWFSRFLGVSCRLVYMPDTTRRAVNPDYAVSRDVVSFADGYPFMLLTEASLRDLNQRLDFPLKMNRFRPNLVISGTEAYAEDRWKKIRIGEMVFFVVKPCYRCAVTTVEQETGIRGKEPLRTLATYRRKGNDVMFGQNLIAAGEGHVKVGDRIEIID